jgi:hypothetical protein
MPAAAYGTRSALLASSAPRATDIPTQIAVTVANETAASSGYSPASAYTPVCSASAPNMVETVSREKNTGCAG